MNDISELERRILYALERINQGASALAEGGGRVIAPVAAAPMAGAGADTAEVEALHAELEAERLANAQLTERVRAIKDKQETMVTVLEKKVARLTEQLDGSGAELQRLRRLNAELIETNQALSDAAREGIASPELLNQSLLTEIEAMRASRAAEMAEMEEVMAELKPLIGEVA
ncbi:MAG: hypothetical protein WBH04_12520 [Albidovulum sp.]|jgi:chromosome segregation ATPase